MSERVGFLFLGETLLIPHLWPVVEALATAAPAVRIDVWVSNSAHAALIAPWAAALGRGRVRLRRAPFYRTLPDVAPGENPPAPASKLPTLALLAPLLLGTGVAVCAEQTSLWIPRLLPFGPTRFIKTAHGAGAMSARDDPRRRAAWRMLVSSERERRNFLDRGHPPGHVQVTGYVKAGFRQRTRAAPGFPQERPVLLYNPHWQQARSSWWDWGRSVIDMLVAQDRFNVILAPHQRLAERVPELRAILADAARHPHVHADIDSFATVDGSYTARADLYLGDTSSQVTEYLIRPRPCVFLNSRQVDWRPRDDHAFWTCGEVVDRLDLLIPALDRAAALHPDYAAHQAAFASEWLGDTSGAAPSRVAAHIIEALRR